MKRNNLCALVLGLTVMFLSMQAAGQSQDITYRVLTAQTNSTLEEELNKAATEGFRLEALIWEGQEILVSRSTENSSPKYEYKLVQVGSSKLTGQVDCEKLEEKINETASSGYIFKDITRNMPGRVIIGKEGMGAMAAMERDRNGTETRYVYRLIGNMTDEKTMKKLLQEAADNGFQYVGAYSYIAAVLQKPVTAK